MYNIKYLINKDLVNREAINLIFKLNNLKTNLYILNNKKRLINGKSLIGLLQANIRGGDIITVSIEDSTETYNIKNIFNNIGREVGWFQIIEPLHWQQQRKMI